eukprot:7389376-Prymnesium_polylepis.2
MAATVGLTGGVAFLFPQAGVSTSATAPRASSRPSASRGRDMPMERLLARPRTRPLPPATVAPPGDQQLPTSMHASTGDPGRQPAEAPRRRARQTVSRRTIARPRARP